MHLSIFLASLGFVGFFVWYLAADNGGSRRAAGLGSIIASLLVCAISVWQLPINLGLDLQGGTQFLLQVQGNPTQQAMDEAIGVLRKRLDVLGTREISVQPEGTDRIKIEIPGLQGDAVPQTEKLLSQVAKLEFRLAPSNQDELLHIAQSHLVNGKPTLPYQYATDYEVLPQIKKDAQGNDITSWAVVSRKTEMSGKHVRQAFRQIEQSGQSVVVIDFDEQGAQDFGALTSANVGKPMAIVLDNVVRTVANIEEAMMNGRCEIHGGDMSPAECEELASV